MIVGKYNILQVMNHVDHDSLQQKQAQQEVYFSDQSGIDQFAAAIAGLAKPGMSAAESLENFLLLIPESSGAAEELLEQKSLSFGLADAGALSHTLEPLIAHHLREFWGKDILPRA